MLDEKDIGIIDSFNNPQTKTPQALELLKDLNLDSQNVKFILITHLHGDHIGGMVELIQKCPNASIFLPAIINDRSFSSFIFCQESDTIFSGTTHIKKLFKFIKDKNIKVCPVKEGDIIYSSSDIKITVLYPNQESINYFKDYYKEKFSEVLKNISEEEEYSKKKEIVKKVQLGKDFNDHSVVVKINTPTLNFLLNSDLEKHKNSKMGLGYVFNKLKVGKEKFEIFKVPHHGSETGFDEKLWKSVLTDKAILKLTCWKSGDFLPKDDIIEKILKISNLAYSTSNPKKSTGKIPLHGRRHYKQTGLTFKILSNHVGEIHAFHHKATSENLVSLKNKAIHLKEILNE